MIIDRKGQTMETCRPLGVGAMILQSRQSKSIDFETKISLFWAATVKGR